MKKYLILFCLFCFISQSAAQIQPDGQKAWDHTAYLASDRLKGRKSGLAEYQEAAEYVAEKMAEYGLSPAGDSVTFFQQVPFKKWKQLEPPIRLDIVSPEQRVLSPGRDKDFFPNGGTGSGIVRGQLVFVGYGLLSEKEQWNDYGNVELSGKIAVILPGAPKFLKKVPLKQKSLNGKVKTAIEKGAAGVLFVNVNRKFQGWGVPPGPNKETCPEGFVVLTANPECLDHLFYLSGASWRNIVSRLLREKKFTPLPLDVTVEMESHYMEEERTSPNVLGMIPGDDPRLKDEVILIGGHLDHLGVGWDGAVYNGADDNAGSIGVILEMARVLHQNQYHPRRTIVFAAWAGEEIGLVGSTYYTEHPVFPLDKTVLYMNMDMVGCGDEDLVVGGMWNFSQLFNLLKPHIRKEFRDNLVYRLDYRSSDHASFLNKYVKAISLRSGGLHTGELDDEHPEYHRPGDTPTIIQPELLQIAAEYHLDLLDFLASTEENLMDEKYDIEYVHKNATVADMHCDTIDRFLNREDLSKDNPTGHIDIPKLHQGNVDVQVFACFVGPPGSEEEKHKASKKAFRQIDAVHRLVEENPNDMVLIQSSRDLRKLYENHKTGAVIGIEGGYAIENDLGLLRSFYRNGVRLMTLTHWLHTDWADASGDPEPVFNGLTEFGEKVVKEMNRLGMIIDLSHAHDSTFWDVIRLTDLPVVASHSCCRALSDHHRNLSDDMIKALAKNGGVLGINFLPGFLNAEIDKKESELRTELLNKYDLPHDWSKFLIADADKRKLFYKEFENRSQTLKKSLPTVNVQTVVDHIDHVIQVTGNADHVGLGSDFDGISSTPEGLEHVGKLRSITEELVRRGYEAGDIKKILGENFVRVFRKICRKQTEESRM